MAQAPEKKSVLASSMLIYPLLVGAIVGGIAHQLGLFEGMEFWRGPKADNSQVWQVVYHGNEIASVVGPVDTELKECQVRAAAKNDLLQHASSGDVAPRHDCIASSLRPMVTAQPGRS